MALAPGIKLRHYEVVEAIGSGGMGEVYRARDTKLGRDVAIKVLPEELSHDRDCLDRFQHEAKLLAALNHTNVATLYGFEESDGRQFLVMELVEGETLAERIARGPIPVEEAIPLFLQIAEGLEAAHEKGVVHRDLKPANIMITPDGQIKILDFGLAKALATEKDVSAARSQSPTLTKGTALGVIMGTAAYMSPEQARGHSVDRRTDVWAFGCCLYEALTGKRAFKGENVTDVLAAVVRAEPDWNALSSTTPRRVHEVLELCLEKERKQRTQHIGDVRIALARSSGEREIGEHGLRPRWRSSTVAALALASAIAAAGLVHVLAPASTSSVTRFTLQIPPEQMLDWNNPLSPLQLPVISPDGRNLVYLAAGRLYLRSLSSFESKVIPDSYGAQFSFFSPDSRWVGFFANGGLYRAPLEGGAPVRIADAPGLAKGGSWGLSGSIVTSNVSSRALSVVSVEDGTSRQLTNVRGDEGELDHRFPHVLPDGRTVLFTVATADRPMIAVASMETGEHRRLFEGSTPTYVATGHLLYANRGSLFAVPFDEAHGEPRGIPNPVLEGIASVWWGNAEVVHYSVSDSGSLVYIPGDVTSEFGQGRLVWVSRDGKSTPFTSQDDLGYIYPRLAPDGSRVAVSLGTDTGRSVWLYDVARGTSMRFTFDGMQYISCWTPDGLRLIYHSLVGPDEGIFGKAIGATDADEPLLIADDWVWPGAWSPDGNVLAFTQVSALTNGDIWILPDDTDSEPQPFLNSKFDERAPVFSPDGRFMAYVSNESGRREVYLRSYPSGAGQTLVSTDGGTEPLWARSGRELFYRSGDEMRVVDVVLAPELVLSRPRTLFEGRFASTAVGAPNYDVSLDDERFLMVERMEEWPTQVNVVLNWSDELEKLVPVGN